MVYDFNKAIRILEGNYKNSVLRHNGELLTVNELIAMLKSQEPIEPVKVNRYMDTDENGNWYSPNTYDCGGCGIELPDVASYCPLCGRMVKWE